MQGDYNRGTVAIVVGLACVLPALQAFQVQENRSCPGKAGSEFCDHYMEFAAEQRTRKRIVAAAEKAGMDDPSGLVEISRDTIGNLKIEKYDLELPPSVEAQLFGYLTPLAMGHCSEPLCSVVVNLDLEPPVPYPHPDSTTDRPPVPTNYDDVINEFQRHMTGEIKRAIHRQGDKTTTLLWLLVDEAGKIRKITVERSSGEKILDQYAIRTASQMEFTPCKLYGAPMACWIGQPIAYEIR